MSGTESIPFTLDSRGIELVGIIEMPRNPARRGVVIVVGGPQYRVGSHRQFVTLSRYLAQAGYPVMRFDHRGIGDSDGDLSSFEEIGPDIKAAIDRFFMEVTQLSEVVIWGLCDAASAAMMYAHLDRRVVGLVLLNPWVRSEAGLAKVYLEKYYGGRLRSVRFWKKLFSGNVAVFQSAISFLRNLKSASSSRGGDKLVRSATNQNMRVGTYIDEMRDGLCKFTGRLLFVLSGNDLTAAEFSALVKRDDRWAEIFDDSRCSTFELPETNHTFSTQAWRDKVAFRTESWLKSWQS